MRVTAFLILFSCLHSVEGLKGSRSRALQDESTPADGDSVPIDSTAEKEKKTKEAPTKKDAKKETAKKEATKKEKETKKVKKCKERKGKKEAKVPEKSSTEGDAPVQSPDTESGTRRLQDETPAPELESNMYCEDPSIKKEGDCDRLTEGDVPSDADSAEGTVIVELTSKNDDTKTEFERSLREETALKAVGCATARRLQDETTGDVQNPVIKEVKFVGADVEGFSDPKSCVSLEDESCQQYTAPLKLYYRGEATEEQKAALFDSFANTLNSEIGSGKFEATADIHYADAYSGEGDFSSNSANAETSSGGRGKKAPIPIVAGVLVAIAGGAGYWYSKKDEDREVQTATRAAPKEPAQRTGMANVFEW